MEALILSRKLGKVGLERPTFHAQLPRSLGRCTTWVMELKMQVPEVMAS